jgi:hypothetical protein
MTNCFYDIKFELDLYFYNKNTIFQLVEKLQRLNFSIGKQANSAGYQIFLTKFILIQEQ